MCHLITKTNLKFKLARRRDTRVVQFKSRRLYAVSDVRFVWAQSLRTNRVAVEFPTAFESPTTRGQVVRPRFERSTIPVAFASRTCRQDAKTPSSLTGSPPSTKARSGKASVLPSARLLSQNARCGNRPPHIQSNIIRFHGPVYFRLEKTALFFGVLSQ